MNIHDHHAEAVSQGEAELQAFNEQVEKTVQISLDTKMDEFMKLSPEDLTERKRLLDEYIRQIEQNIETHPSEFANNRLRRTEVVSMTTLSEVFQHRINELLK
ncbi:MAG: hypothetical protein V4714_17775 [Bacteroidota bacterium]